MTEQEIVKSLKDQAETWIYSGLIQSELDHLRLNSSRCYDRDRGVVLLFTRDSGHHTGGWFKNPDYERCYHLSISFRDIETGEPAPFDRKRAEHWVKLFYGKDRNLAWCEPAYTIEGKKLMLVHYRVYCDENWQAIKPRGEVYSRELTESGWKSFSELHPTVDAEFSWGNPS